VVGAVGNGAFGEIVVNWFTDQQLGQMYELMQAIRKRELEENDPEQQ
jgi:phage gp16-like protein